MDSIPSIRKQIEIKASEMANNAYGQRENGDCGEEVTDTFMGFNPNSVPIELTVVVFWETSFHYEYWTTHEYEGEIIKGKWDDM